MDKNIIIERFYRDHKNHVYNFLCRITDEPELALEITQQTFVQALSDENVTQIANPKTYLFTIARNILFTEYELVTPAAPETVISNDDTQAIVLDEIESPEPISERLDIQAKVEKSIKRMPVETKELMVLQYTEDLTNKEISVVTSRSVIDVKVNLHRARVQFESYLKVSDNSIEAPNDQCDTLQAILTPHIDSKIPENYLQLVEQHISNCEICINDAEKKIQSKILFNLAPLISTPNIFDKKMSDAMASKFKFLSVSNRKKRKKSSKFNPKNVTKNEQEKQLTLSKTKDKVTESKSNENKIVTQETNTKTHQDTKLKEKSKIEKESTKNITPIEKSKKEPKQDPSNNVTDIDISKKEIKKDSVNKISNIDTSKNEINSDPNKTVSTLDSGKNKSKKDSINNVANLNYSKNESEKDSTNILNITKSNKTTSENHSETNNASANIVETDIANDTETKTIDALKNTAAPNTVTGKILSAQSNMSIIFSVLITVVIIVLFNTLFSDSDNSISAQINVEQDENDITVKQKIIPNSSSIVSFKALNIQTGHTISNGLNWEIYSKDDIADKSKKLNLIQKSSAAEYNIVLNYGKYLAKVRFKDKVIKSDFEIKNDNPVEIILSFNNLSLSQGNSLTDNTLPTIHIRRKETRLYKSKPIKLKWDRCVRIIKRYLKVRSQNSKAWRETESDIQEKIPNFRLNRGLAAEPKWSKLAENIEDEYFSGNKYALYKKGNHYRITNDGSCRLIKTSYRTADIDDGKYSYHINYINKTAAKSVSQVVIEKSINAMNSRLAQDKPKSPNLVTFENNALNHNSNKVFINKFSKITGSESIAGEKCVYSSIDEQLGARSCYWKSMQEYPSLVKRDIILKTSSFTKKKKNLSGFGETSKIATLFEKDVVIKDKIFSIPANMFITDNTH